MDPRSPRARTLMCALYAVVLLGVAPPDSAPTFRHAAHVDGPPVRWGASGHEMAARAAMSVVPADIPDFFSAAEDQLVYLDPEPDRWRVATRREMSDAWAPDHYVNFEDVPPQALQADNRYAYVAALHEAGHARPDQAGFLPFTIVELYQRLVTEWELWRGESDPDRRSWIQSRIIYDAGIMGHFVTDGAQPHHTTIHYNGWATGVANPEGYTRDRTFHARFETDFVDAHLTQPDVSRRTQAPGSAAGRAREAVMGYLAETHSLVEELYRLDRDVGFDPVGPPRPQTTSFAAERLAAGASMLALLWWSAWEESR